MKMEEEQSGSARIAVAAAVTGVVMGILYHLITRQLQESIIASEEVRRSGALLKGDVRAWAPVALFAFASGAFGWASAWIAARVSGLCGAVLWIPIGITLAVAIALGLVLNAMLLPPMPNSTWIMFTVSAVAFACLAGYRMKFED